MTKEIAFTHAKVVNSTQPLAAAAFTVADGKFKQVFDNENTFKNYLKRNPCEVVDLAGQAVVPGQVDTHTISTFICKFKSAANAEGVSDALTLATRLKKAALAKTDEHGFVFATGWQSENLDLTLETLDELGIDKPIAVFNSSFHGAQLNSVGLKAIDKAGIKGAPKNGLLMGPIFDTFVNHARPTPVEFAKHFMAYEQSLAAAGVTTAHDLVIQKSDEVQVLKAMALKGLLKLRWRCYVTRPELLEGSLEDYGNLKFVGVKVFIDGSYGMKNAHQDRAHAYSDGSVSESKLSVKDIVATAKKLTDIGGSHAHLAAHCIGYAACETFLKAAAELRDSVYTKELTLRALHFETADDKLINRAKELGVIVSMQPAFSQDVKDYAKDIPHPEHVNPMKRVALILKDKFAIGSDSMPIGYMKNAALALNPPLPTQKVTDDFIKLLPTMTRHGASITNERQNFGAIKAGQSADFVVLSKLPRSGKDCDTTEVLQTWVKGKQVFAKK